MAQNKPIHWRTSALSHLFSSSCLMGLQSIFLTSKLVFWKIFEARIPLQWLPTSSFPLLSQWQTLGASQEESIKTTGTVKENKTSSPVPPPPPCDHFTLDKFSLGNSVSLSSLYSVVMELSSPCRCMEPWGEDAAQELFWSLSFCYLAIETQTLLLQV